MVNTLQRDISGYVVMLCFSTLLLVWLIPAYSPEYPGYGVAASFVPNVAAGVILILALIGLARALFLLRTRKDAEAESTAMHVGWLHLTKFFIPCAALMPAMHSLGFIPAGIVFMGIMQLLCGQRRPLPFVLVALIPVLVVYALMRYGLGIPLP